MDKIEHRGGARPGSGRKAVDPQKKRVQISVSISPDTAGKYSRLRRHGVKVGRLIDDFIADYCEKNNI